MLERRKHDRTRSFAAGTIAYGRDRATLDCVVRNQSAGGALLLLDEPRRAPVAMELAMRDGMRPARVVWRDDASVGVAFAPVGGATSRAEPASAVVVSLDAARRSRAGGGDDDGRLAERIVRFVRPTRVP